MTRILTRRAVVAGSFSLLAAAPAHSAPDWPDRPITIIHGFPPGGPTDLVVRIIADPLTRRLGQRVVVEGKPGASGTTAAAQVARAAPSPAPGAGCPCLELDWLLRRWPCGRRVGAEEGLDGPDAGR